MAHKRRPRRKDHRSSNYRSAFERSIANNLSSEGVPFKYEETKLEYTSDHVYTPDFELENGILVEAKGWFEPKDRTKMLAVKKQHPDRDIRMLFANASNTLSKRSKTTYGAWCDKHGYIWAEGRKVPKEWIDE